MVFGQSLCGNHFACAGLFTAMSGLVVPRCGVVGGDLCRSTTLHLTRACLVGLQRQAPIAAACIARRGDRGDRCNRPAIAVQRIRRDTLALERDQAQHFKRRLQFSAISGGTPLAGRAFMNAR